MQRKIWTHEEDKALKELIIDRKIKKWCAIARAMEVQYKIPGRSGKQCRERWHNQLDPKIKNDEWTKEQQQKLFQLHDQLGNKWAMIAHQIPGRTDNCLKNHFYSTLRKAIRRLNRFISDTKQKGQMKQIKNLILRKILLVAEDKFDKRLSVDKKLIQCSVDIKRKLIQFITTTQEKQVKSESESFMRQIITDIMNFTKNYKKKNNTKKKKSQKELQIPVTSKIQQNKKKLENSNELIKRISSRIITRGQSKNIFENLPMNKYPSCQDKDNTETDQIFRKKSSKFEQNNNFPLIPIFHRKSESQLLFQSTYFKNNPNISLQQSNMFLSKNIPFLLNSDIYKQR